MRRIKKGFLGCALIIAAGAWFCAANYRVPILMYHRVDIPAESSGLFVSPQTIERQMEFLKVHHYNVIALRDLVDRLKNKKALPAKAIVITFDDGTIDNIDKAFPVLKKMNFPATIFMITENIDKKGWLSREDLRLMDGSGIEIGSHTAHHAFLPSLKTEAEIIAELHDSKAALEEMLGHRVALLSYPGGGFTERVRDLAIAEGYEGAVTTNHGKRKDDLFALTRVKIQESGGSLFNFWFKTCGFYQLGKKRIEVY